MRSATAAVSQPGVCEQAAVDSYPTVLLYREGRFAKEYPHEARGFFKKLNPCPHPRRCGC
eukprot:SAG31_NODE_24933_length_471_cov_1.655914_1_plen_59_part_01